MDVEKLEKILIKADLSPLSATARFHLTSLILNSIGVDERDVWRMISTALAGMDVEPQAMAFSVGQLAWLFEGDIAHRHTSKVFKSGGLAITAIVAARRCYARVGGLGPMVEAMSRFFAHVSGSHKGISLAREIERSGEPDYEDEMLRAIALAEKDDTPPEVRCLLQVARLTLEERAEDEYSHNYGCEEHAAAYTAFDIVSILATEVNHGAAREFIATLDALESV